jgi:hypothetical protein
LLKAHLPGNRKGRKGYAKKECIPLCVAYALFAFNKSFQIGHSKLEGVIPFCASFALVPSISFPVGKVG